MSKSEASLVTGRYKKILERDQDIFDEVEVNKNLYRNKIQADSSYEWDYSLSDPHVFPIVRNYIARSNMSSTKIQLEARKPSDYEKRQINQDFVNWELNELALTDLLHKLFFSAYVTGKGYLKTCWKYERPLEIKVGGKKVILMRDIVNRAEAKFVRFNDLLIPNRNITSLADQPYLIELVNPTIGDLLDDNEVMEEEMWDKKWLEKIKKSGARGDILEYQIEIPKDDSVMNELSYRSLNVPLIRMQTKDNEVLYVPLKGDEVVNKNRENPYWHGHYPYLDFTPLPEDDDAYPASITGIVADLQIASTELLNQTMTNVRQINNNMWVAGTDAASTPDFAFNSRPNGIIRVVGDVNQVQQIRSADNTVPAIKMSQELQNKIERASGISSLYSSGVPGQSVNQTARGAQIIDQNIDTNIKMILDLFGAQILKPLGEHFLELNAQYVTEDQSFYVTGKKGVRDLIAVTPDQISANFNVYVNPEKMVKQTPASRQASLQNLLTVLNSQVKSMGVNIDVIPLVEALIDSYPDMENVDDLVSTNDEKAQRDIAMMERGQMPEILERDAHKELITIVGVSMSNNPPATPEASDLFEKYIQQHLKFITASQQVAMMGQPAMPQAAPQDQMLKNMQGGMPQDQAGLDPNQVSQTYDLQNLVGQGQ